MENILAYIGTILVGFEFLRRIDKLWLMLVLVAAFPVKHIINAFPTTPQQREGYKWRNIKKSFSWLKLIYSFILVVCLLPLSLLSFFAFLFTGLINVTDELLNILWKRLIINYKDIAKKFAGILIQRIKKYHNLQPNAVIQNIINTRIPFIPVIGIILILISFFMYIF